MSAHCLQATTQEVHIEDFTHDDVLLMLQWMYGRLQSIPENHAQASPNLLGTRMLVVDKNLLMFLGLLLCQHYRCCTPDSDTQRRPGPISACLRLLTHVQSDSGGSRMLSSPRAPLS